MPLHNNNFTIKDKKWVIETFLPLLNLLNINNIPAPHGATTVNLSEHRDFIIKGMGYCIVSIRQEILPSNTGGILITAHHTVNIQDKNIDTFRLNILINTRLCGNNSRKGRLWLNITAIHEFTHTIAALSAISRIRSSELIARLKKILRKKAHMFEYKNIKYIFRDLCKPLIKILLNVLNGIPIKSYFDDNHYRLGFEDIQASYPNIFEGFLLPNEIFNTYFTPQHIRIIKLAFRRNNAVINAITKPIFKRIHMDKALPLEFIKTRFYLNFLPTIVKY